MSTSQEQSLNEDIIFLPVTETSPDFLYSETERLAVERLLDGGPEAFYSTVGIEHSSSFLSSEEVTEITNWAQDYHLSPIQKEENGVNGPRLHAEDFSSTYFPLHSDMPAPDLALGWPERSPWAEKDSVRVYTSPPAEGEPSVRELIRQQLQTASKVIAVVTDRLTDCAVIGDLHSAASRGVPVYIILNQRSAQENSTLNRLWHPNMQVRALRGKSFCSRAGRMVAGEMKNKFVLVDLQTVIHGSYSLTWTDAHLHRQLVTVLTGSVVDFFDREFRILFAASSPVPDARRTSCANITQHLQDFPNIWLPKHLPLDAEIINPPSPPSDTLLDWEAMGVIPGGCSVPNSPLELHEDVFLKERPQLNNVMLDKKTIFVDNFFSNKHLNLDKKRLSEPPPPPSPVNFMSHLLAPFNVPLHKWKEPPKTEMRTETSNPLHKWKESPNTEMRTETSVPQHKWKEPPHTKMRTETSVPQHKWKEPPNTEMRTETSVPLHKWKEPPHTEMRTETSVPLHKWKEPPHTEMRTETSVPQHKWKEPPNTEMGTQTSNPLHKWKEPPNTEMRTETSNPLHKWKEPPNTEMRTETSVPQHKWKEPPHTEMRTETSVPQHKWKEPPNTEMRTETSVPQHKWKEPPHTEMRTEASVPQHKWKEPPNAEMRTETRIEPKVEIAMARQISTENSKYSDDKYLKRHEKEPGPVHDAAGFSHIKQRQDKKEEASVKEETSGIKNGPVFKMENTPSSRKPVILRLPHSEDPSSLSDIMKRMKQKQSTWEPPRDRANTAYPEPSRSMVELSGHNADQSDKGTPVPRFRASTLDVELVTPALALMQKRNDHIRTSMYRPLLNLQPRDRPRSFAFGSDWRKSLSELEGQEEGH